MTADATPVAIIGLGGRFPGEATDPQKLWDMCAAGADAWTEVPASRFAHTSFYHPDAARNGATNVQGGFFLRDDLSLFDAPFFGLTATEAASLDPQQRLLLECSYEALESAGLSLADVAGTDMGVFVGSFCFDWAKMTLRDADAVPLYHATGTGQAMLANRLSYFLDVHGPSLTLDTACSSSLVALHQAVQALRAGTCATALVAGVNCTLCHDSLASMSSMGFLSAAGRSFTYDSRAAGYGRGEGVAALVLQRVDDALTGARAIRAVVRHTGVNQDGRTPGITFPSGEAQAALIRSVYAEAGLDLGDTSYVEAHGTGTQAGDPIEARALFETFGRARSSSHPLVVGCVKTNIGHLEGASGAAGLVKTVLMLERETVLPNSGFGEPNAQIPLAEWRLAVPTSTVAWRAASGDVPVLRASVNGFGYGGTNAHVIVESAADYLRSHGLVGAPYAFQRVAAPAASQSSDGDFATPPTSGPSTPVSERDETTDAPHIFLVSAHDETAGRAQLARLATYVADHDHDHDHDADADADADTFLADLAHTLGGRRSALPWKAAVAASSVRALQTALSTTRMHHAGKRPRIGLVFTGQGAQWHAMGRELATTNAVFRASLDRSAAILQSGSGSGSGLQAEWSLHDELLRRDATTTRVHEPAVSQPLCTVLQVALVDMLRAWGVAPTAVVGHSSGEIAAAYAAGLLSQEAAVAAAYFRVPLASATADACRGGMMAVACDESTCVALLKSLTRGKAVIACYNSPQSFTVSGDDAAMDELADMCRARAIRHRKLAVAFAYHSHRMVPAAEGYRGLLQSNETVVGAFAHSKSSSETAMYSSVTGKRLAPGALTLDYWVDNLVNPVRFTEALTRLCYAGTASAQVDVLVEVGPHAALAGPMRQVLQAESPLASIGIASVLRRGQDATETAQELACMLLERGVPLNVAAVNASFGRGGGRLLVDLPPYAWNRSTAYWAEPVESIRYRQRAHARHDLLGAPVRFGSPLEPRWRQWIRPAETPWVRDHRVQGLVVYPAAAYICMAMEAARQDFGRKNPGLVIDAYELRDVSLGQALIVPDAGEVEALVSLKPVSESSLDSSSVWCEFFVYACTTSASASTPMGAPVRDTWAEHCRGRIAVRTKQTVTVTVTATDTAALDGERARLDAEHRATHAACTTDVDVDRLYARCTAIGLEYGPTFANLTRARHAPSSDTDPVNRLVGTVTVPDVAASMPAHTMSPVVVHPGTLDACLHGIMSFRNLLKAAIMPVFFRHIHIAAALEDVTAGHELGVFLGVQRSGFRNLDIDLVAYADTDDTPLIRMDGLRMTSLAGSMSALDADPPKTYFAPVWKPDPGLITSAQLRALCAHLAPTAAESAHLRRLDQSAYYMAADVVDATRYHPDGLSTKGRKLRASLERLRDAVNALSETRLAERVAAGLTDAELPVATDMATWPCATPAERAALLDELADSGPEGRLLAAVSRNMAGIVLGTADPLTVTMADDVLGQYYAHNPRMQRQYAQAAVYVDLLAHKNPHLRLLEIGAGTGGATLPLLRALGGDVDNNDRPARFASYDVTDISSGFFEQVRDKARPWVQAGLVHFQRLDIEHDPARQGFVPGTYDVVVAANVLHATRNMARTVAHARSLLRPGGVLVLIELVRVPEQVVATAAVGNIFGIFDGWWVAEEPHRQDSPLLAETQWDAVLRENGFSGLDAAVWETPDVATHQGTTMISTAVVETEMETPKALLVTDAHKNVPWLKAFAAQLAVDAHVHMLDDVDSIAIPADTVIVVVQSEAATVGLQTPASMAALRRLFYRDNGSGSVFWITRGASDGQAVPDFALVDGFLRTLRVELGGRLVHLDLDLELAGDDMAAAAVFRRSFAAAEPELELAIRGPASTVFVPRYDEHGPVSAYVAGRTGRRRLVHASPVQPARHLRLEVGQPGLLDTLYFDDAPLAPLADDDVEIRVCAAGLNFHDIMVAMGQIETRNLGRECAGVVTAIGRAVTDLVVGDRVAAPADATVATTIRCAAWRAQRLPDTVSFAQGAALPIVLCTALHTLRLARLEPGESVLVHAASGGLGQALVQLCLDRGAVVYATVGSPAKKAFLVDQYGLDPAHIFSSRDDSFEQGVMQATGGAGVDVVCNVLAGELLRASWRCVASFGRFIELGKRDLARNGRLDMGVFARNVSFSAVDLVALLAERPAYGAKLWAQAMDLVRKGIVHAPTPLAAYSYADAHTAMATMQAGRHIGKLVLVPDQSVQTVETVKTTHSLTAPVMSPHVAPVQLRPDASYLLVGGLGGIGRALAARMVDLGARHLVFLTRGGATSNVAVDAVDRLRAAGARVLVASCDVGHADQLAAALASAADAGFPAVRGAVNLGLVMESALFHDMSSDSWNRSLWPKVPGTWNLHNLLPADLEFFVLVSSMVGTIGNPSQAAYGAASTFQDAFAQWRRRQGLPGASVDLGMIGDIGYVAEHGTVQQTLVSQGFEEISGDECLAILEAAMLPLQEAGKNDWSWSAANFVTGLGLGRYSGGDPTRAIYGDPRFRLARRMAQRDADDTVAASAGGAQTQSIRDTLRAATALPDVLATLEAAICTKIVALLMLPPDEPVDTHKPLSQYGLDSLIAVELRNWVSSEMEATVPVLEFLGSRNIQSLCGFIARQSRLVRKELLATHDNV